MGVIKKALNDRPNQRIAAKRLLQSPKSEEHVPLALEKVIAARNAEADRAYEAGLKAASRVQRWAVSGQSPQQRHYERLDEGGIIFGSSADEMMRKGFNPANRVWVAVLGWGQLETGGSAISIELRKWSVDGSGFIANGDRYVGLVEDLAVDLEILPRPDGPLFDPNDLRFTSSLF